MPTKAIVAVQGWLPGTADDGRFARHVLTLACGTLAAQLVTVASAPLLARLYSPASFGAFGALIGLGSVLGAVAGLKYELAIVLEKSEPDARASLRLVLAVSAVFAVVILFGILVGSTALGAFRDHSQLVLMLPLFVLLFGWSQALNFWATRHEQWFLQAQGELARNLGTAVCQLVLGLLAAGPLGLMAGRIVGELAILVRLWRGALLRCAEDAADSRLVVDCDARLRSLAVKHRDLVLYQTPRAFLHSAMAHVPALLLAVCASPAIAGLYWFAARLLRMLATLVASAVRRVFFKGAIALHQEGESTRPLLIRVTILLGLAGALPAIGLAVEGPELFALAFGEQWRAAGGYARLLALWCWFDLTAAPAAMLVSVYAVQRTFFCVDLLAITSAATALVLTALSGHPQLAIGLYVAAMAGRSAYGIGFMLMHTRAVGSR